MYLLADVRAKLEELGISPKKSLGQNFLVNPESIQRILEAVKRLSPVALLEVGPGLGALTEPLAAMGKPLTLIELDRALCEYWRSKGLTVVEEDALRVEWGELVLPEGTCLVSNLPYQISASLVVDRSVDPAGVSSMVLMFQKEVGQRLMARPRTEDYGMLSVVAQAAWSMEKLFEISSKDFFPPPAVASRVLVFRRKNVDDALGLLKFVKAAFSQRRKFLIKNLSSLGPVSVLETCFQAQSVNPKVRAEELSVEQFQKLFGEFKLRAKG